jgi:hypothetical protein
MILFRAPEPRRPATVLNRHPSSPGLWAVRRESAKHCSSNGGYCEVMRPSDLLAALFQQDSRLAWLNRIALVNACVIRPTQMAEAAERASSVDQAASLRSVRRSHRRQPACGGRGRLPDLPDRLTAQARTSHQSQRSQVQKSCPRYEFQARIPLGSEPESI